MSLALGGMSIDDVRIVDLWSSLFIQSAKLSVGKSYLSEMYIASVCQLYIHWPQMTALYMYKCILSIVAMVNPSMNLCKLLLGVLHVLTILLLYGQSIP